MLIKRLKAGLLFNLLLCGVCLLVCAETANSSPSDSIVILKVQFEDASLPPEIGTGFFADHDGLIITADHVLNKYAVYPPLPPYNPGKGKPALIEVYSRFLNRKFILDLAKTPLTIVYARTGNQWLDIAAFRLNIESIDPTLRGSIVPLQIATDPPFERSEVFSYGPKCIDPTDDSCFEPVRIMGNIINDPNRATEFLVGSTLRLGFSGGPLLDSSDRVVGICRYGERVGTGSFTGRASYITNRDLLNHLTQVPYSIFLGGPDACANADRLPWLTYFDVMQVSSTWKVPLNKDHCDCCCRALDKSINAVVFKNLASKECLPGSCALARLNAQIKAVQAELNTGQPDIATVKNLHDSIGAIYAEAFDETSAVSRKDKIQMHVEFAAFLKEIATDELTAARPEFSDAPQYALRAYALAEWNKPQLNVFGEIADLFALVGDKTKATQARFLMKPWRSGYKFVRRSVLVAAWSAPTVEHTSKE